MANSPLVSVRKLSPNCSSPRNHAIDRLTPHHTAGVLSVESALEWFAKPSTQASCNYVVGGDGRIGLCVNESDRAWTSSSRENDNRAITFEVVNSQTGGSWPVSNAAFNALVNLCIDICKRYGKKRLLWIKDKNVALSYDPKADEMLLTMHQWFANTNCPGQYLGSKFPELAERVTKALNEEDKPVADKNEPSAWAAEAWEWAKRTGITDGKNPKDNATRQEVVTMLYRFSKVEGGDAK